MIYDIDRHHNPKLANILLKCSFQASLVQDISSEYNFKYDIVFKNLTLLNLGNFSHHLGNHSSKKVAIPLQTLSLYPIFTYPCLKPYFYVKFSFT